MKLPEELDTLYDKCEAAFQEELDQQESVLDFSQFFELRNKHFKVFDRKYKEFKLTASPVYSEMPSYGDKMTLEHFVDCVKSGGFINYDGGGNYATEDKMTNIPVSPSDVLSGVYRKDFDYIIWFNK